MTRFKRVVIEMEVEIEDEVQLSSFVLSTARGEHGEVGPAGWVSRDAELQFAISRIVNGGFEDNRSASGLKMLTASAMTRSREDDVHPSFTVPPEAARRDDGTYADAE